MKIEHKKILRDPSKIFEKYFMAHQYMPKIFHGPPPTYLMYGPIFAMTDDFTLVNLFN